MPRNIHSNKTDTSTSNLVNKESTPVTSLLLRGNSTTPSSNRVCSHDSGLLLHLTDPHSCITVRRKNMKVSDHNLGHSVGVSTQDLTPTEYLNCCDSDVSPVCKSGSSAILN